LERRENTHIECEGSEDGRICASETVRGVRVCGLLREPSEDGDESEVTSGEGQANDVNT
jgi:hypothetical protein